MSLTHKVNEFGSITIDIEGDLNIYQAAEFKSRLQEIEQLNIIRCIVNLEFVHEIDVSGLQIIIALQQLALEKNVEFFILKASESVLTLLNRFGLKNSFIFMEHQENV